MPLVLRLDRVMADRKMSLGRLAELIDLAPANVSRIKTGKIKAIRFSTLERLCEVLDCQPGDLIEYQPAVTVPDVEEDDDRDRGDTPNAGDRGAREAVVVVHGGQQWGGLAACAPAPAGGR